MVGNFVSKMVLLRDCIVSTYHLICTRKIPIYHQNNKTLKRNILFKQCTFESVIFLGFLGGVCDRSMVRVPVLHTSLEIRFVGHLGHGFSGNSTKLGQPRFGDLASTSVFWNSDTLKRQVKVAKPAWILR